MKTTNNDEEHWTKEIKKIDKIYDSSAFIMPVHYIFCLTNNCNLRCPFCFLTHNVEDELNFDDWMGIVEQLPEYARVVFFGGEPLLYKDFDILFKEVSSKFSCSIVTNGTLLDESKIDLLLGNDGLKNIFISIDTVGNRNRNFTEKQWINLIACIELFNIKKKRIQNPPKLGINTVILNENTEELFELHRFSHEKLCCDYVNYCLLNGASMQLSDDIKDYQALFDTENSPGYDSWDMVIKNLDKIREYNKDHGHVGYFRPKVIDINSDNSLDELTDIKAIEDNKLYGPCKIPWADCRIHPNGFISHCLAISYGNVKEQSLEDILQSDTAKKFKEHIKTSKFFPQCKRCVMRYHQKFYVNT